MRCVIVFMSFNVMQIHFAILIVFFLEKFQKRICFKMAYWK